MSSPDNIPEGYVPCDCHPETCCHEDGLKFVGITRGITMDELKRWKSTLTYSPTHLDIFEAGVKYGNKHMI